MAKESIVCNPTVSTRLIQSEVLEAVDYDIHRSKQITQYLNTDRKRNDKKWKMFIVMLAALVIALAFIMIATLLLELFALSSNANRVLMKIGDDYTTPTSAVITVGSSISDINLTLYQPQQTLQAAVYIGTRKPLSMKRDLPEVTIPELSGRSRFNYNYYEADEPIFLHPGSSLQYIITAYPTSNEVKSSQPCRLYLFDDELNYGLFLNDEPTFKANNMTDCFTGNTESGNSVNFIISQSGLYYVAIEIDDGYLVTSNVSATITYYNTTGLARPASCSDQLTIVNPSCSINLCSRFYCSRKTEMYVVITANGYAEVEYTSHSSHVTGTGMIAFIFSFILFGIAMIIIISIVTIGTIICVVRKCNQNYKSYAW